MFHIDYLTLGKLFRKLRYFFLPLEAGAGAGAAGRRSACRARFLAVAPLRGRGWPPLGLAFFSKGANSLVASIGFAAITQFPVLSDWQRREDWNLRMSGSKPGALSLLATPLNQDQNFFVLPLHHTSINKSERRAGIRTQTFLLRED